MWGISGISCRLVVGVGLLFLVSWSGERLLMAFSKDLELIGLSLNALHLNGHAVGNFKEFERFGEGKGRHLIFPKLQMHDSEIVEVELWVKLLALLVHLVGLG